MPKDGNEQITCTLTSLPPFAPVSQRLVELFSNRDDVVEQVAELLGLDAESMGGILRLARTPAFGFERQLETIAHRVTALGMRRVKALVTTAGLKQSSESHRTLEGYWRHSVASGFLALELATEGGTHTGEPDMAGLRAPSQVPMAAIFSHPPAPEGIDETARLAHRLSEALGFPLHEVEDLPPQPHPSRVMRLLRQEITHINN